MSEVFLYDNCIDLYLVKGLERNLRPFSAFDPNVVFDGLEYIKIDEPQEFDKFEFKTERDEDYYGFKPIASLENLTFDCYSGKAFVDQAYQEAGADANVKFIMVSNGFVQIVSSLNFTSYVRDETYTKMNTENAAFDLVFETRRDVPYPYSGNYPVFLHSRALRQLSEYNKTENIFLEDIVKPDDLNSITEAYGLFNSILGTSEIKGTYSYPDQLTYVKPEDEKKYVLKPTYGGNFKINLDMSLMAWNTTRFRDYDVLPDPDTLDPILWNADITVVVKVVNGTTGEVDFSTEIVPTSIIPRVFETRSISVPENYRIGKRLNIFEETLELFVPSNDELYIYVKYLPPWSTTSMTTRISGSLAWGISVDDGYRGTVQRAIISQISTVFEKMSPSSAVQVTFVDLEKPALSIIGDTLASSNTTVMGRLGDVFYDLGLNMLNKPFVFQSQLLDDVENGELYNLLISNGFLLRSTLNNPIEDATKQPRASFNQLMAGVRFLVNAGFNVEFSGEDEVIRIEKMDYFFQDKEIVTLSPELLSSYEETVDPSYIFNEIEVGYNKFSKGRETNKRDTIDDPHGVVQYLTPIKRNKQKFSLKGDFILSGTEIEIVRRKQFEEDLNSNEKDDGEIYAVQAHSWEDGYALQSTFTIPQEPPISSWSYRGTTRLIIKGGSLNVVPVVVGDGVNVKYNGVSQGTFTVEKVAYGKSGASYVTEIEFDEPIPITPAPALVTLSLTMAPRAIVETTQPFQLITGINSPETAYNLRWSPARIVRNWGKVINSGLNYKDGAEVITFQKSDANHNLETKLKLTERFPLGDILRAQFREDANMTLTELYGRQTKFTADEVVLTAFVDAGVANYIMAAHYGASADDNNYGYIQVPDGRGNIVKGYMTEFRYQPATKELNLTLKVSSRISEELAEILRPITDEVGRIFIDQNGNYFQYE